MNNVIYMHDEMKNTSSILMALGIIINECRNPYGLQRMARFQLSTFGICMVEILLFEN